MKDVKEFLENKYNEYKESATSKQYIDRKYTANILSDDELCECIEDAPDWEFCEIYGLLNELSERTNAVFLNEENEFDESLVYEALARL